MAMPRTSQILFASLLLLSAIGCLASCIRREPKGAYLERGSLIGCALALIVYTATLPGSVPVWNTSLGLVFAGIAVGCLIRGWQVHRFIRLNYRIVRPL